MTTEGQRNYSRLGLAVNIVGTKILRYVLQSEIKPHQLHETIKKSTTDATRLLTKIGYNDEKIKDAMFNGYDEFDFALLYTLIRSFCKDVEPPTKSWGCIPEEHHTTVGDDIERLRQERNYISHHATISTSDEEFHIHWDNIENIVKRMENRLKTQGKFFRELLPLKTALKDDMDSALAVISDDIGRGVNEYVFRLFELLKRSIFGNRDDSVRPAFATELQDTKHENTLRLLMHHEKDKTFVATGLVDKGLAIITNFGVLIFTGGPNMGKMKNALEVMRRMRNSDKDCILYKLDDVKKWEDCIYPNKNMLVLMLNIDRKIDRLTNGGLFWKQVHASTETGLVKVILTVNDLTEFKRTLEKLPLFESKHIINLSSEGHQPSVDEKRQMIKRHCISRDIHISTDEKEENYSSEAILNEEVKVVLHESTVEEITSTRTMTCFGYLCYQYCKNRKYIKLGPRFFKNPSSALVTELDVIRCSDPSSFFVLCYMWINDSKIRIDEDGAVVIKKDIADRLCQILKIETLNPQTAIIRNMEDRFVVNINSTEYTLRHENIADGIAITLGNQSAEMVLTHCSKQFITEYVRTQSYTETEGECFLKIRNTDYIHLIRRFLTKPKEESNDNGDSWWWWWTGHQSLDDKQFIEILIKHMSMEENFQMAQMLIASPKGIFYGSCYHGKIKFVKSLYDIFDKVKGSADIDYSFKAACQRNCVDVVQWFLKNIEIPQEVIVGSLEVAGSGTLRSLLKHESLKTQDIVDHFPVFSKNLDKMSCEVLLTKFSNCEGVADSAKCNRFEKESVLQILRLLCKCGNISNLLTIIENRSINIDITDIEDLFKDICKHPDKRVTEVLLDKWPIMKPNFIYMLLESRLKLGDEASIKLVLDQRREIDLTPVVKSSSMKEYSIRIVAIILASYCELTSLQTKKMITVFEEAEIDDILKKVADLDKEELQKYLIDTMSQVASAGHIRMVVVGSSYEAKVDFVQKLTKSQLEIEGCSFENTYYFEIKENDWLPLEKSKYRKECTYHFELTVVFENEDHAITTSRLLVKSSSVHIVLADMEYGIENLAKCYPEMMDIRGEQEKKYKDIIIFLLKTIRLYSEDARIIVHCAWKKKVNKMDLTGLLKYAMKHIEHDSVEWNSNQQLEVLRRKIVETSTNRICQRNRIPKNWEILEKQIKDTNGYTMQLSQVNILNSLLEEPLGKDEVTEFLRYLNDTGKVFCQNESQFSNNHVVIHPTWLKEAIETITNSGEEICENTKHLYPVWIQATENALFDERLIRGIWNSCKSKDFSENLEYILNVFNQFHIIASATERNRRHLFPFYLKKKLPSKSDLEHMRGEKHSPIFCIDMGKQLISSAVFYKVLAACMEKWRVCSNAEDEDAIHLYSGCAIFDIQSGLSLIVSFLNNYLQLQVWAYRSKKSEDLDRICSNVREYVCKRTEEVLQKYFNVTKKDLECYVKCIEEDVMSEKGYISVKVLKNHLNDGCNEIKCSKYSNSQHKHYLKLSDMFKHWFPSIECERENTESHLTFTEDQRKEAEKIEIEMICKVNGCVDKILAGWTDIVLNLELTPVEKKIISNFADIFEKYKQNGKITLGNYKKLIDVIEKGSFPAATIIREEEVNIRALCHS